ncbi:MAG: hypothetical protein U9Q33_05765 [Campylobacterota bacterium]|nr:hypothetical protein [Campylobacterota bacterium]
MKKVSILAAALFATVTYAEVHINYNNTYEDMTKGFKKYRVVESTPITKKVTKRVRVGDEITKVPCGRSVDTNSIGLDTIVGITAGIALGNRFKNNRDMAKVVGGLGGAYMANQMRNEYNQGCYEQRTVQEPHPRYKRITEDIIIGYNNCVTVDGKKICKKTKRARRFLKVKKTYTIY